MHTYIWLLVDPHNNLLNLQLNFLSKYFKKYACPCKREKLKNNLLISLLFLFKI